jgi:predicted DCC family thiol-disulfide oxidoreductase YuxK
VPRRLVWDPSTAHDVHCVGAMLAQDDKSRKLCMLGVRGFASMGHPILLYDGVCGLCNYLVHFVLRRDRKGVFRFAWLQGEIARHVLERHGMRSGELDTVYIVVNYELPEERLLARSDAVGFVLGEFGWAWRAAAVVLRIVPRVLRDAGYSFVARNRYRLFGRSEMCRVPGELDRGRFID